MAAPAASELLMTYAALCRAAHTQDTEPSTLSLAHCGLHTADCTLRAQTEDTARHTEDTGRRLRSVMSLMSWRHNVSL